MIELDRINLGLVHQHNFDPSTNTYTLHRIYGICSNMMVAMHGLAKIISLGHNPQRIIWKLAEYVNDLNLHPLFFQHTNRHITQDQAKRVVSELYPTSYGLSNGWTLYDRALIEKNLAALNALAEFFTPNWIVRDELLRIVSTNDIDPQNTTFIWARGTDKLKELALPQASDYVKLAQQASFGSRIIVQTDDHDLADEFRRFKYALVLEELPFTRGAGFHNNLCQMNDVEFVRRNLITKFQYIARFLALLHLSARCKTFIGYPGNLTTMIPAIRGTFEGCYLFKNQNELV